ncbi:MAG: thioredoxin domain-containing protein [Acidobacteriia bacterium]|nr:thioredoxin domain-containing protein [Terriglobia bacterium]
MRKSLSLLLSLVGFLDSLYLLWVYISPFRPLACLGTGCDAVRASAYARFAGYPVPLYGVLAYSVLVLLILAEPLAPTRFVRVLNYGLAGIAAAGVLFSGYLTYLEAFVIHAWCVWCIVSALAITLVFVLSLSDLRQPPSAVESRAARARAIQRLIIVIIAMGVGLPAFRVLSRHGELPPVHPPSPETLRERLVRPDSHIIGNPRAPVTVVEFGDFSCPACGQVEAVMEEVRARYATRARFVFRQFPLTEIHPHSEEAAEASECAAAQGKFWEAVKKLYTWQEDLSDDALKQYAAQLGLDQNQFDRCLTGGSMQDRVRRDLDDGFALGVRATPTFFIGRRMVEGPLSIDQFSQLIDSELASRQPTRGEATESPSRVPSSP